MKFSASAISTGRFPEEFVEKAVNGFDVAFAGRTWLGALPADAGAIEKA